MRRSDGELIELSFLCMKRVEHAKHGGLPDEVCTRAVSFEFNCVECGDGGANAGHSMASGCCGLN